MRVRLIAALVAGVLVMAGAAVVPGGALGQTPFRYVNVDADGDGRYDYREEFGDADGDRIDDYSDDCLTLANGGFGGCPSGDPDGDGWPTRTEPPRPGAGLAKSRVLQLRLKLRLPEGDTVNGGWRTLMPPS